MTSTHFLIASVLLGLTLSLGAGVASAKCPEWKLTDQQTKCSPAGDVCYTPTQVCPLERCAKTKTFTDLCSSKTRTQRSYFEACGDNDLCKPR